MDSMDSMDSMDMTKSLRESWINTDHPRLTLGLVDLSRRFTLGATGLRELEKWKKWKHFRTHPDIPDHCAHCAHLFDTILEVLRRF